MKLPLLLTLLLASLSARAELIEAQGSAAILGGDEVYAREQATRDALRQALLASGREGKYSPGPGGVRAMTFSPDGRLLVTAGYENGAVRLWDVIDA